MKTLTKWFRKYIFWLNGIRYISILMFSHPPILINDLLHPVGHGGNGVDGVEEVGLGKGQYPIQGILSHL
jgi:hypothetical protein